MRQRKQQQHVLFLLVCLLISSVIPSARGQGDVVFDELFIDWEENLFSERQGGNSTAGGNNATVTQVNDGANSTFPPELGSMFTNTTDAPSMGSTATQAPTLGSTAGTTATTTIGADNNATQPQTPVPESQEGTMGPTTSVFTPPPAVGATFTPATTPATATNSPTVAVSYDTSGLVYITIDYGFGEGAARNPSTVEIQDLMCQTNDFIAKQVQAATGGSDTVLTYALNVDWSFINDTTAAGTGGNSSSAMQPVTVSFASQNSLATTGAIVPAQTVVTAMQIQQTQIEDYIQNYVWNVQLGDSLFKRTTSASFDDAVNQPIPAGQLAQTICPFDAFSTPAPMAVPVPVPGTTTAPSAGPIVNGTTTAAPSAMATTAGNGTTPQPPGNDTDTGATFPTFSPQPPSVSPTRATEAPVPAGSKRQPVRTKFLVTNLEGITSPAVINGSGLVAAWPVFVQDVVAKTAAANDEVYVPLERRRLLKGSRRRRLTVELEPDTAYIYEINLKDDCGGEDLHPDSTCHDVYGVYNLLLREGNALKPGMTRNDYGDATVAAIEAGELQKVLDEEAPDSKIYIGTVADPNAKKGMPVWLIVLIVLLCILFCCCLLGLIAFFLMQDKDGSRGKNLDPYDEEGFAYDFLIPPHHKIQTEVDDDIDESAATKNVDEDELFEDEDGVHVAQMVKDGDDDADMAPATIMEESDDEEEDDEEQKADSDNDSDDDDEQINVSAEVVDEDEDDNSSHGEVKRADTYDDPDLVEVSNDMESESNWDESDAAGSDNEDPFDDEDDDDDKKKTKK